MTDPAAFLVRTGETVTAFALGPLEERSFKGPMTRGLDKVDYGFINGFVDVGDLPCRIATWEEIEARGTPELRPFEITEIALPGFNRRLEFSGFWHLPHRLSRWCRTRLVPHKQGDHAFRLATSGGVNIWVDGRHIAAFEPFSRNHVQETEITLPLKAEGSDVVLLIEEMAERDTNYFIELTWCGAGELITQVESTADPAHLDLLMALARDVRPAEVVFAGGEGLRLCFDEPAERDVTLEATISSSVHLKHKPPLWQSISTLHAGKAELDLGDLAGLEDGYHALTLKLSIGEATVRRSIAFAKLDRKTPPFLPGDQCWPGDLSARKTRALRHAADHGEKRTGRLLAMLALGRPFDALADEILSDTLDGINKRRDCSDFVMVPLLWIMAEHQATLPAERAEAAKRAILNYRYWMDEPGNDSMWFWSENHVLCFHVSEYLAGRMFPDMVFPNGEMTGRKHAELAETRLLRWLASIKEHGFAEWNSAAYYPIDFIGLLALVHLGEGEIRSLASGLLDRLFTMIALHVIGGVAAGSMGRAYDKELRAGPLTELSPFAAVAFGTGWLNGGVAALPMFCLADYAPAEELAAYAAPKPGTAITARYVQGYGAQGRLALHKTSAMQLSACIDAEPGASGHQQHLVDVQSAAAPFARVWINHPGEDDPWGSNRPSYWAGNGVMPRVGMEGATCLFLSDIGERGRLPFTHAYAPVAQFDAAERGLDFLVLTSGEGAVILKTTGPIYPLIQGPGTGLEWRCAGRISGWALQIRDLPEGGVFKLAAIAKRMRLKLDQDERALSFEEPGRPVLRLSWKEGLFRDERHLPFPTSSTIPDVIIKT